MNLAKSIKARHTLRFWTKHPEGDKYSGILLGQSKSLLIFQVEDDFTLDGLIVLPKKHLKKIVRGLHERICDRVLAKNGELKKLMRKSWVTKIKDLQEMVAACGERNLWPVVETKQALYLGPITAASSLRFQILAYDADGTWEMDHVLRYDKVFKIEVFDAYSTHFNSYMAKRLPTQLKKRP